MLLYGTEQAACHGFMRIRVHTLGQAELIYQIPVGDEEVLTRSWFATRPTLHRPRSEEMLWPSRNRRNMPPLAFSDDYVITLRSIPQVFFGPLILDEMHNRTDNP